MKPSKAIIGVILLMTSFLSVGSAEAIRVRVLVTVGAPICCLTTNVSVIHMVWISDGEPAWWQEPVAHTIASGVQACIANNVKTHHFCCVGIDGETYSSVRTDYNNVSCPIAAKGYSYAKVGGYGSFPLVFDEAFSVCRNPCRDDCIGGW